MSPPKRSPSRSRLLWIGGGLLTSVATVFAGPNHDVPCRTDDLLPRLAIEVGQALGGGTIDTPTGSYCQVPNAATWLVAGLILSASILVAWLRARSEPIAQDPPQRAR